MKVLLVHNRYRSASPSGEDRVVDQEAAGLVAGGQVVERFERFSDDIARRSLAGKALVPAQVLWSDESRRSLTRTLASFRPDVVHIHNIFPLLSPSVLYACRSGGVPVVVTLHHYGLVCPSGIMFRDGAACHDCVGHLPIPAIRHGCYRGSRVATVPVALGSVVHRRAWRSMVSAYVFLSASQRDVVAPEGLPPDRVFVKPNFVPDGGASTAPRDPLAVYAGRLSPVKGLDVLMAGYDGYCARVGTPAIRLVVAGAGPQEAEVAAWAATRSSVDFVGLLSRSDCAQLLARARAAVVPSAWQETFGLVVVEAMAAGVAPVASAHGSFSELIADGVDGVLFPPGSASALAAVFCDMEAHPERFSALGQEARRTYERRFTEATNMEQLLDIYRFAIGHPVV